MYWIISLRTVSGTEQTRNGNHYFYLPKNPWNSWILLQTFMQGIMKGFLIFCNSASPQPSSTSLSRWFRKANLEMQRQEEERAVLATCNQRPCLCPLTHAESLWRDMSTASSHLICSPRRLHIQHRTLICDGPATALVLPPAPGRACVRHGEPERKRFGRCFSGGYRRVGRGCSDGQTSGEEQGPQNSAPRGSTPAYCSLNKASSSLP